MSGSSPQLSPLTLQMLMASNGGLGVPQDPAIQAALPRLQMAQSMMQNGMSDAPIGPAGALGRLGQAILGNVMFGKANEGIQDILTQRAQQAGNATNWIMGGAQNPAGTPAVASASASPPAAPGGFATQLASSEGTPTSVNNQGYAGQFQFGTGRLASTGLYTPAPGENLKGNEWKGTLNIPGFPNVKTQKDFLGNPQAQNAALGVDIANTDKAIANTPGAGAFDQNGLRAVAHLGGVEGMQKYVTSNGQFNPADANGTSLSDYYHKFSGSGQPAAAPGAPSVSSPAPGVAPAGPNPWEVIRRAGAVLTNPAFMYNQQAQQSAQHAIDIAKLQIQTGSYSQTSPGVYTDAYTGKPVFAPTPRMATDVHGNLIAASGGGQTNVVSPNPSGYSGNTPEANAMRTIAELGPKVQGGTATPQEVANYNTALPIYQGFKTTTTSPGQTVTSVPTRELPVGAPPPATPGAVPGLQGGFTPPTPNPTAPAAAPPVLAGPRTPQPGAAMPPQLTPEMPPASSTGPHVVVPPNTSAIAQQAEAAAQGSKAGEQAAVTLPRMVKMGTEAVQGLGTIDSAISQLNEAQKGGIPTGYFTPALATAAAAAKSLGIDTSKLGVDPAAVSTIQAANKSLALTAGSIVRQILGPDSQITEGKLETFIHATPGLNTDPQAIQKILGWARSQFTYNHSMAMDAMQHADPTTGMIAPGWESQYYTKQGSFGPIYNPLHGEMEQPKGTGPAATAPTQEGSATPPKAPAFSQADAMAEARRRGLIK